MRQGIRLSGLLTAVALSLLAFAPAANAETTAETAAQAIRPDTPSAQSTQGPGDGSLRVTKLPEDSVHLRDFAPGDRTQWAAEITNTGEIGDLGLEFVVVGESSALADPKNALQITVDLCSTAYTPAVSPSGAMTFTCPGAQRRLGQVTSAADRQLGSQTLIAQGETVGVRARILFPASADNSAESASAAMDVLVTVSPSDGGLLPEGEVDPPPGGGDNGGGDNGGGDSPGTDNPGTGNGGIDNGGDDGTAPTGQSEYEAPRPALFGGLALTGTDVLLLLGAAIIIISLGITFRSLAPRHRTEKDEEDE